MTLALPLLLLGALLLEAQPLSAAEGSKAAGGTGVLTVLAAGDLRGEIKPCGCSPEGQMGGLARRMTYLARHLGEEIPGSGAEPIVADPIVIDPIVVDLGNNHPEPSAQGELKGVLINRLWARYMPEAVLPGPNELGVGASALPPGFPWVASNEGIGRRFAPFRTVKRRIGGVPRAIGIYGYLSPALVYQGSQTSMRLEGITPALLNRWRGLEAEARHDLKLLLFRGSDEELVALGQSGLFDLIVAGNPSPDELNQITRREAGGRAWPQVPTKGQGFLRIEWPAGAAPPKSGAPVWEVDWLKDTYADHPEAPPVFAEYDRKVKAMFFARLEIMDKQQRESPFAGAGTCAVCHPEAQRVWQGSRHAGALGTLRRVGKQFDPECLACHVAGLERGGFLSEDLTPKLGGVQCENCHGPSRAHVKVPATPPGAVAGTPAASPGTHPSRPDERTCRTCHVGSHSPIFDFPTYWPKVAHRKKES